MLIRTAAYALKRANELERRALFLGEEGLFDEWAELRIVHKESLEALSALLGNQTVAEIKINGAMN